MMKANPPTAPMGAPTPVSLSGDAKAVEAFLQLLARAVRQFHTYPANSPMCVDAVAACQKSAAVLEGGDQFSLRVTAREFVLGDVGIGGGTIIEQELVRRLHHARVGLLDVNRAVSKRDLSRFCTDLLKVSESGERTLGLADLLVEHGIETIVARMAERPEILDLGVPAEPLRELVTQERQRHDAPASGTAAAHLYPPGRGWVRLDPTARFDTVSLVDLAVLVNDPNHLAEMLLRLAEEDPSATEQSALERKFTDVATLIAALDPKLARHMFGKLARAVLDLDPERRQTLLRRTILPGLLEGRIDGAVLQDFPDPDLADSLCLLLDLETAAPNVLSAALDRMELSAERRQAVVPLLENRLEARAAQQEPAGASASSAPGGKSAADRYARKLIKIDSDASRSFAEFTAFDLSMDDQVAASLARIRDEASALDRLPGQLRCLASLVKLEPNPNDVERFLAQWSALLAQMERASRWAEVAAAVAEQRRLAESLRARRPDVADAIAAALVAFCTRDRLISLLSVYQSGDGQAAAKSLLDAYGAAIVPACLALLEDSTDASRDRLLAQLLSERGSLIAPELAARLAEAGPGAARAIVKVLGSAGAGYETAIAQQFKRRDEQTIREALQALAQIGSGQAAGYIASQLEHPAPAVRQMAEQSLWRVPAARTQTAMRELLGKREFVVRNPALAMRLLDRAAETRVGGLDQALGALAPLRFRFWMPAVASVGRKARKMMHR
ncbi:MAG: HEAT repeat domain-containing protein [Bacteroidales bacterium]